MGNLLLPLSLPFPRFCLPENPLLPHRKLQELYTLMQRCRALDLKHARAKRRGPKTRGSAAREALLAATSIHLLPGDLLCAEPGDHAAEQLAPIPKASNTAALSLLALPQSSPRPLLCAAAARGLQAAAAEGIVLAYANIRSSAAGNPTAAGWGAALEWAQSAQLPLLLACTDANPQAAAASRSSAWKSGPEPLNFRSMSRLAHRLRLPLLPVDGEDAVAVYRVMQESALRARMGGGPAVIWALMSPTLSPASGSARTRTARSSPPGLPRAQPPIARLRSYLTTRGIPLPG